MTSLKARPRKTVDDFMKLPEGARAELIEGEIFMSPSPKARHQRVGMNLTVELTGFIRLGNAGQLLAAPCDVHLPSGDIVQPDLIFVSTRNQGIIQDWIRGVPDLLVEIVSPDAPERDRIVKRRLYERNGVPEYWIVDPQEGSVEVLSLKAGAYASHGFFEKADTVTSPSIPGLSLPVASLLA